MPRTPWDNPDLDDYEYIQGSLEGAGGWADLDADLFRSKARQDEPIAFNLEAAQRSLLAWGLPELAAPVAERKRFRIIEQFKGQTYARTESGWSMDGVPYTYGPITGRLDAQLLERLTREDRESDDPGELVRRAWFGQAMAHHDRVVDLAQRTIRSVLQPPDPNAAGAVVPLRWRHEVLAAAAMLCSAHRQLHDGERALEETESFASAEYAPLMTSRAAAMCDVARWDEGRDLAIRARDLQASEEIVNLLGRIDRHFMAERTGASNG